MAYKRLFLQVSAKRFRILMSVKKVSRIETSNQYGALARSCNVLLAMTVDSGMCLGWPDFGRIC